MTWGDIDAARAHLAQMQGGRLPSKKTIYNMVRLGLKVSRLSETGPRRDSQGRLRHGRLVFSMEWLDQFLEGRAK